MADSEKAGSLHNFVTYGVSSHKHMNVRLTCITKVDSYISPSLISHVRSRSDRSTPAHIAMLAIHHLEFYAARSLRRTSTL